MAVLDREQLSRDIRALRYRTEEVRTAAEDMCDAEARRSLLLAAASYEKMADRLEVTASHVSLLKTG